MPLCGCPIWVVKPHDLACVWGDEVQVLGAPVSDAYGMKVTKPGWPSLAQAAGVDGWRLGKGPSAVEAKSFLWC